ncbi:hypothetical protein Prudu_263S000800, partial [Prunus dulcis]
GCAGPPTNNRYPTPGRVSEPCNRRPFRAVRGALESAAGARLRLDPYPIFGPIPPSYYQKMRFLPNPSASVAYNVNPVADQFQRAFQTSTFCNRLYSFFNKRWFFDQVLNDFLVRSFLRFGYEVSFEALDKGAIEILGPYGISYTFRRLAERISQLQSGFVVRRALKSRIIIELEELLSVPSLRGEGAKPGWLGKQATSYFSDSSSKQLSKIAC